MSVPIPKMLEIPLDALSESALTYGHLGFSERNTVRDTLELLGDNEKQILYLYYFKELPQADIAKRLRIPLGTVKSRLHGAKANFKKIYPYPPQKQRGEVTMKNLPEYLPEYKIEKSDKEPFAVKWEENIGWFIIPRLGEKISWAIYDYPDRRRAESTDMEVIGKAEVHGIEGVEIISVEHDPMEFTPSKAEKTSSVILLHSLPIHTAACLQRAILKVL